MTARARSAEATGSAADFLPPRRTLPSLRRAAAGCRGCHLWKVGTQTVFGEGARTATLMFVGEQPGDQEDRAGKPFVGPSGRLLDSALERAGLLGEGAADILAEDPALLARSRQGLDRSMRGLMRILTESDDPRAPLRAEAPSNTSE